MMQQNSIQSEGFYLDHETTVGETDLRMNMHKYINIKSTSSSIY